MSRAVDRFWGIPAAGDERLTIGAAGPGTRSWVRVDVDLNKWPGHLFNSGELVLPELRPLAGEPLITALADGRPVPLAARRADGAVELAFEPDEAVAQLTSRAAMTERPPVSARLPFAYHAVPPGLRRVLRNVVIGRRSRRADGFPSWPVEPSVELVRHVYLQARGLAGDEVEPAPFWPDGKRFALCLTQDVDSAAGLATAAEIQAEQAERGLRCCWFLVGRDYAHDPGAIAALRQAGGEFGLHDVHHDNKLAFLAPDEIAARLDSSADLVERLGIRGFRSPSMLRTEALYHALEGRFAFDSSMPDTGLYPGRNGCATVFPIVRGDLVVLPASVPPDGQLLARGADPHAVVDAWIAKIEWIRSAGGLAVHLAHPDPGFTGDAPMRAAYRRFLDWVADQDDAWHALPSAVADHWRARTAAADVVAA